jgi:predicted DNA-binding transcriptional regulator YafY
MSTRPDTLETTRLAIELLRRIPRVRKITAMELQQQLEDAGIARDLRTIQRQLESLSEHFQIERDDSSKPFGYRWRENACGLSLPIMTEQEALLLALAEQHLRCLLPATVAKSMEGFFTQARRNLAPDRSAKQEREWLKKVRVVSTSQPLLPPPIRPGVLEEVSNALYGNLWLEIDYKNAQGKRNVVEVMPLGLAQQGPSLYLVCRYRDYDNERSLALHRMHSAKASTLGFERPPEFDLAKYDNDGRFHLGDGKRIRVTFNIEKSTGNHLLETKLSTDQTVKDLGGSYQIAATVVDSEWLWNWLRGFGDAVSNIKKRAASVPKSSKG